MPSAAARTCGIRRRQTINDSVCSADKLGRIATGKLSLRMGRCAGSQRLLSALPLVCWASADTSRLDDLLADCFIVARLPRAPSATLPYDRLLLSTTYADLH